MESGRVGKPIFLRVYFGIWVGVKVVQPCTKLGCTTPMCGDGAVWRLGFAGVWKALVIQ
jgi:hypothetical protein